MGVLCSESCFFAAARALAGCMRGHLCGKLLRNARVRPTERAGAGETRRCASLPGPEVIAVATPRENGQLLVSWDKYPSLAETGVLCC